ncbi:hypothetical protein [Crateriforma spongiae]|uniref:hypothetical protein n=1 Tax=Crateriforma spongiae TaxID=2724528 RepID=UPI0014462BAF|nr:hypothetical protein [Crateriforma spongiae]
MDDPTAQIDRLTECIPDDLYELWRMGPLRFVSRDNLPVVELTGRKLTLIWGSPLIVADAADCNFRVGRPWKMKRNARSARPFLPFGNHDLILIDFPPLQTGFWGGIWSYNTAPVGYTKDSLNDWANALAAIVEGFDAQRFLRS